MKTVARQSVCLFPVDKSVNKSTMYNNSLTTSYTFRAEGDRYIHALFEQPAQEACCVTRMPTCLCDYAISITSNQDARLIAYTRVAGELEWLADSRDRYVKLQLQKGKKYTFTARLKSLVLVTLEECRLSVKIRSIAEPSSPYEGFARKTQKGHVKLIGVDAVIQERSRRYGLSSEVHGLLHRRLPAPPMGASIQGMQYYLRLASLITLSYSVDKEYRCPPYSVALAKVDGYRARLSYDIELKPSAGESAVITLTAIESQADDSYSILQDDRRKDISHERQGTRVTGEFLLPVLCPDVGIHIYTPYGFRADIGDDPATSLAKFHTLKICYTSCQ